MAVVGNVPRFFIVGDEKRYNNIKEEEDVENEIEDVPKQDLLFDEAELVGEEYGDVDLVEG